MHWRRNDKGDAVVVPFVPPVLLWVSLDSVLSSSRMIDIETILTDSGPPVEKDEEGEKENLEV
jgi:hypothetical protein